MRISGGPFWGRVARDVGRGMTAPARSLASFGKFVLRSLGRAFAIDLQRVQLSGWEQRVLATEPVVVGQYLAWRRGVLFLAMILLAVNLGWQVRSFLKLTLQPNLEGIWTIWLYVLESTRLGAVGLLPIAAGINCLLWRRVRWGRRLLLTGTALAFVIPIALSAVPPHVVFDLDAMGEQFDKDIAAELAKTDMSREQVSSLKEGRDQFRPMMYWLFDVIGAVIYTALLIPSVFAIFPGVLRACLRVKTLLPGTVTPGWCLMSVIPLYLVFAILVLAAINVIFQSPELTTSLALLLIAPLLYLVNLRSLLRPWPSGRRPATFLLGGLAMLLNLAALVLLVTYLATKEFEWLGFFGKVRTILGRSADEAVFDYWDLTFFLTDYFGRSLFLTAVVADLLLTATVSFRCHAGADQEEERLRGFSLVLQQ